MESITSLFKLYFLLQEWPVYIDIPQGDVFEIISCLEVKESSAFCGDFSKTQRQKVKTVAQPLVLRFRLFLAICSHPQTQTVSMRMVSTL